MENGRVVKLELEEFGLTGAVPAEVWAPECAKGVEPRRQSS